MKTLDYLHLNENKVNSVVSALHQLLADFQVHYTNLRGFHWDIKGHGFFVLHSKFEDMYNDAAEKVDEIAERILMLGFDQILMIEAMFFLFNNFYFHFWFSKYVFGAYRPQITIPFIGW